MVTPVELTTQYLSKLSELGTVYQHVWDISEKISGMENDPLPQQLQHSIPGFMERLEAHTGWLNKRTWPVLVLGDSAASSQRFLHQYLGWDPAANLPPIVLQHTTYVGYHHRQYARVVRTSVGGANSGVEDTEEPFVVQNWEGLASHLESLRSSASVGSGSTGSEQGSSEVRSPFERLLNFRECLEDAAAAVPVASQYHVEIYQPIQALKGGLQLVLPASNSSMVSLASHLAGSHGIVYLMDSSSSSGHLSQQFEVLMSQLLKQSPFNQHLLDVAPCIVIADQHHPQDQKQETVQEIQKYIPNFRTSSFIIPNDHPSIPSQTSESKEMAEDGSLLIEEQKKKEEATNGQGSDMEIFVPEMSSELLDMINSELVTVLEASVASKCHTLYSWLYSFIGRVMHHLRAFLSQAEKSDEERRETYAAITQQLQNLTTQTDDFFKSLRKEVDSKVVEALTLLRSYLIRDDVLGRLAHWSEDEAPNEDIWIDVDNEIRQKIAERIRMELIIWEDANKFFKNLRPCLIVHFEQRFVPIEHKLNEVETQIARHDSHIQLGDVETLDAHHIEKDHDRWCLPGSVSLKWQQKVLLGVAAPVLLPLAVTLVFLGLPIIGGLMAKDLIVGKISENKLREYNLDRVKYLRRRTVNDVTKFCRSRNIELFIESELQPAYDCITQLQKIVPSQIEANLAQIDSLKRDVRDAKDVARFYLPLVEVFEHYKLLLMLYKVLHVRREKIDLDPKNLDIPEGLTWTSVGLRGSIKSGYLKDGDKKKMVSVKFFKVRLDIHNIDDYIQEESAYRFQASSYIAKFLGICKLPRGEFTHILEPLKSSLRDYAREHCILGQKGDVTKAKYDHMKQVMTEVVRGLDYLHERGWVHFDLNMDSVCVDFNDRVKLINISSRRMLRLPTQLAHADIYKYTHLPPEVLMNPPAAYTHLSEMYCVGVMMWELWTGQRAYYLEIGHPVRPLTTMEKFVAYIEQKRPDLSMFYNVDSKKPVSKMAEAWVGRLAQCWSETDRISSKAWLQLMDDVRQHDLHIQEHHFNESG